MATKKKTRKPAPKPARTAEEALLAEWLAKAPKVPKLRRPKDRAKVLRALEGFEQYALEGQESDDIDLAEFGLGKVADMTERIDLLLEDVLGEEYVAWITAVPAEIQEQAMFGLFHELSPDLGKGSS